MRRRPQTRRLSTALAVYAGATMVEGFRAGLAAVPRGLIDAGKAIGLPFGKRLLYVIAPQAAPS